MFESACTFTFFCAILNYLCFSALCIPYLEDDKPIESILNDLLDEQRKDRSTEHEFFRRQLDLDKAKAESWTGRWFPEKETEKPLQISYGEIPPESWTGKWFPSPETERPMSMPHHYPSLAQSTMWSMINSSCDDGKTNLTVDWPGSPINYTCVNPHNYLLPDYDLPDVILRRPPPPAYRAAHACMDKEIHYSTNLPTYGTHRPAWPRFGEYQFVPPQRWIHSLEHGAIVMLYHPCAHPELVDELREIVSKCLYRHIISPYTLLSHDRPFALLAWGWALLMSAPSEGQATSFIRNHALHGPEALSKDGQFSEGLLRPASIVTDHEDSTICPQILF